MTEAEHIALTPSKKVLSSAKKKNKPEASRKGEPEFIMTEEMEALDPLVGGFDKSGAD